MWYVNSTLNTANSSSFSTWTPTLEFTWEEDNWEDIRYELQVDNVDTFDSNENLNIDYNYSEVENMTINFWVLGLYGLDWMWQPFISQWWVLQMVYLPSIGKIWDPIYNLYVQIYTEDDDNYSSVKVIYDSDANWIFSK